MDHNKIDARVYDELRNRTLSQNAKECIFPIFANSSLNSEIAVSFRTRLKKKLVYFLVDDNTEEEFLIKAGNKDILDQYDTGIRAYLLQPHLQTTLLINECIALEMVLMNGNIKLVEPPGSRKDRYTAVSYLNYYVSLMDTELLREKYTWDDETEFLAFSKVY
jgi:hypothetical protein